MTTAVLRDLLDQYDNATVDGKARFVKRIQTAALIEIEAQQLLRETVEEARTQRAGWTWARVGEVLGVSRQAAQQRFRQVPTTKVPPTR